MTNKDNLLVIELKKTNSRVGTDYDIVKLKAFTSNDNENPYQFKFGILVEFESNLNFSLTWFSNGHKIK
jgi:hypothetical protein